MLKACINGGSQLDHHLCPPYITTVLMMYLYHNIIINIDTINHKPDYMVEKVTIQKVFKEEEEEKTPKTKKTRQKAK